jgi:Arc/MetJ-type ribon-helix-helix transcriptional regulator
MTVVSVSIPTILDEELKALVRTGYYENKSEIFRTALREFLAKNRNLRISIAIEMYKADKATFAKAAEIAGVSYEEMKDIFWENGVVFERGPTTVEELEEGVRRLKERLKRDEEVTKDQEENG